MEISPSLYDLEESPVSEPLVREVSDDIIRRYREKLKINPTTDTQQSENLRITEIKQGNDVVLPVRPNTLDR